MASRRAQTSPELWAHLIEQYDFLRSHAAAFDAGQPHFAKPLATTLRVLLHHNPRSDSHALLAQLGVVPAPMLFLDSGGEVNPANRVVSSQLVGMKLGGGKADYVAPLDQGPASMPPERRWRHPSSYGLSQPGEWHTHKRWWLSFAIFKDDAGETFTRADIVRAVANSDGGAHVDRSLKDAYDRLTRSNSLGWILHTNTGEHPLGNPVLPTIRQIAWEVEQSLLRQFPQLRQTSST